MIELTNICKTYQNQGVETHVLSGVNLQIHSGEYVAIMGPSGSGKSTLLNILGCMDTPTSGCYLFQGHDMTQLGDKARSFVRNRRLGFVFQLFHLLPRLTALDNVLLPLLYTTPYPDGAKDRALLLLNTVGLSDRVNYYPNQLSGGQQQRVAIARALINEPLLLVADEPTGNLDSQSTKEIMGIFSDLHREGRTIVLVTHDPAIAGHAERILAVRDGTVASQVSV